MSTVVEFERDEPARTDARTVRFDFEIGQRVVIRGSSIEADIIGMLVGNDDGKQYQVVYWYSGARLVTWVFAREIVTKSEMKS